jgi:uncharacterized UPF0160 family protein
VNSNILLFIEADYKNKILFFLLEKESLSCVLSISLLLKHGKIIFKQSRELNKKFVGVCTEKLVAKIEKYIY